MRAQCQAEQFGRVLETYRDAIVLLQSKREQRVGGPVRLALQLREGESLAAFQEVQGQLVGHGACVVA
ncbi:hypothetical protein D3C85_1862130 [compost metagenome]